MSFFDALSRNASEIAYSISKDGFGESIQYVSSQVARSAAQNKVYNAAKPIINALEEGERKAVNDLINKGSSDFMTPSFEKKISDMLSGDDEAAKKVASEFSNLSEKFNNAAATDTVASYAEFLGRENGKLSALDAASGYFLDKQHGSTRIKTAIGAGVGVGVASRVLSGGSLTRTNSGERDIAGIPFI